MRHAARRLLAALPLVLLSLAPARAAEPFFALEKGTIWVHENRSEVTGVAAKTINARAVTEAEGEELIAGKKWMRLVRKYQGMPGVDRITVYRRVDENGIYTGTRARGAFQETLELALPAALGRTWDYDDGTPSKRTIADVVAVETPAGKFESCLKVVREYPTPDLNDRFGAESYYCPKVGEVKTVITQKFPQGQVVTVETLVGTSLMAPTPAPAAEKKK